MNKYQEALRQLINHNLGITEEIELKYEEQEELFAILQELADKEIPMKPIQKGDGKFLCGKCKFTVADNDRNFLLTRCGNSACGQVVDWSVE